LTVLRTAALAIGAAAALAACDTGSAAADGNAAAASAATTGRAAQQQAMPEGLFGNVRLSPESGDLGGFEIRFYRQGDQPMAELVLCQGWCNQSYHSPVTRQGDGYAVSYTEMLTTEDGKGEALHMRFLLTPGGTGGFAVAGWYNDEQFAMDPVVAIDMPFGLDVANTNSG
jgi:hypothetical protein